MPLHNPKQPPPLTSFCMLCVCFEMWIGSSYRFSSTYWPPTLVCVCYLPSVSPFLPSSSEGKVLFFTVQKQICLTVTLGSPEVIARLCLSEIFLIMCHSTDGQSLLAWMQFWGISWIAMTVQSVTPPLPLLRTFRALWNVLFQPNLLAKASNFEESK